jgi:hypothetical protein
METWKQIPQAPLYEISDLANIRRIGPPLRNRKYSDPKGSILPSKGYVFVVLRLNGGKKTFAVHRLIMAAFHGTSDLQVNHINGIKHDNRLCNLEYVDGAGNRKHAKEVLDAYPKGSGHPNSKLTEKHVRQILGLISMGYSDSEIGEAFGVTAANIYVIRNKKGWTHVTESTLGSSTA